MQNNTPQEILDEIKKSKKVFICMDSRFDFDSLCSVAAIHYLLDKLNIDHEVVYEGQIPEQANKLVDTSFIQTKTHPNTKDLTNFETLITLDTGQLSHLTVKADFTPPKHLTIINIDHHAQHDFFGHFNFCDPTEASTCTVLLKLFKEWGVEIDAFLANTLLLGLLTDTGFLQFQNTTTKELKIASELIEHGADMFKLIHALTFSDNLAKMKARALIYNHTKIDSSGTFAYSFATLEDIKRLDIDNVTLDFINASDLIKQLSGIKFAFVVKELEKGVLFNVSMRSHDSEFDVSVIAKKLGGGGHKGAAGANIKVGSVQDVIEIVRKTYLDVYVN